MLLIILDSYNFIFNNLLIKLKIILIFKIFNLNQKLRLTLIWMLNEISFITIAILWFQQENNKIIIIRNASSCNKD